MGIHALKAISSPTTLSGVASSIFQSFMLIFTSDILISFFQLIPNLIYYVKTFLIPTFVEDYQCQLPFVLQLTVTFRQLGSVGRELIPANSISQAPLLTVLISRYVHPIGGKKPEDIFEEWHLWY